VNERTALAVIDRDHGSLEDFVISLLGEKREALDDTLPLTKRAEIAGLPLPVFARVISSPQFRALLRVDIVNSAFGIEAEMQHVERVAGVARGEQRLVMSPSGKFGRVDQAPTDVIAAGKYLNELRGTPIEKATQSAPSVVINIGKADEDATSITIDTEAIPHQPQRAGGLPPAGVRGGFAAPKLGAPAAQSQVDKELGHLYGANAEEADEDHALSQKRRLGETEPGGQNEPAERQRGNEMGRRIRNGKLAIWGRNWPGRGEAPVRAWPRVAVDD
jgi:hypothetical protein